MKQLLKYIFLFLIAFYLIIQGLIIKDGIYTLPKKSDVIVVLGCRLYGDIPSPTLRLRLEKTVELYNMGYGGAIIVSGGQGEDEWVPEAKAMKLFLVQQGIPEDIIFEESNSFSTYENLKYSRDIMQQEGFEKALIVTSSFHVRRALMITSRLGMDASGGPAPLHPNPLLKIKYYTREVLAYLKDFVRVKQ